jgi:beta-glucanase (GH16 family)
MRSLRLFRRQRGVRWWVGTAIVAAAATASVAAMTSSGLSEKAMKATDIPKGNLPGWTQRYAEDFDRPAAAGSVGDVYGPALRGYSGFTDTSGNGTYTPDSVLSVSGGVLDYYLHTDGVPRVAAPVMDHYRSHTYGRYSVRFRSDPLAGFKIAFLLWPESDSWHEGEIDWPEGNLTGRMSPASAITGSYSRGAMRFDPPVTTYSPTDATGWHVATTEWTPGSVKWFWDGALVGSTTFPSGVPTTGMRWVLQAETALDGTRPIGSTAGHLQVDWAVSYAYTPPAAG